jgi:shikimate kinase
MKIYLVGFMGCGKTTVGKHLASRLDFTFLDMDELFSHIHACSIENFLKIYTEKHFRQEETKILHQTKTMENVVIATGGGTSCFFDNMQWMLSNGTVVYLKMSTSALYNRLKNSKNERPLLSKDNLKTDITNLLLLREPIYQKAHISVDGLNFEMNKLIDKIALLFD